MKSLDHFSHTPERPSRPMDQEIRDIGNNKVVGRVKGMTTFERGAVVPHGHVDANEQVTIGDFIYFVVSIVPRGDEDDLLLYRSKQISVEQKLEKSL